MEGIHSHLGCGGKEDSEKHRLEEEEENILHRSSPDTQAVVVKMEIQAVLDMVEDVLFHYLINLYILFNTNIYQTK